MAQIMAFAPTTPYSRMSGETSTIASLTRSSNSQHAKMLSKLDRIVRERPDAVSAVERMFDSILADG